MKSVYFAHPTDAYATPKSLTILKRLGEAYPGYKIIDPEDFDLPDKPDSCRDCMQNRMKKHSFPAIDECEKLAIWDPVDSCVITCESVYAWMQGKEVVHIDTSDPTLEEIGLEELTLQEFYFICMALVG